MSDLQPNRRRGIIINRTVQSGQQSDFIEAPFPDRRSLHWVPPDGPTADEFSIVVTPEVLLQTSRHVSQTLEEERGGFLLGNRYRCPNTGREYIVIDQYIEAGFTESTDVSLTFTHEAWGHLDEKLTGKHYGKQIVGWYHSHPRMSIFLSEHDIVIHRERFAQPWMVALVLEPDKHMGGFFRWLDGKIDPNRYVNFYELLEGEPQPRETVVAWKNYEGVDPLQGAAPPLAAANTLTAGVPDGPFNNNGQNPAVVTPQRPDWMPVWLHGNISHFGLAALAIVIFLSSLGFMIMRPRISRWWNSNQPAPQQASTGVFKGVQVKLEDRGAFNTDDGTVTVLLNMLKLPEDVARDMNYTITIDGREATVKREPSESVVLLRATAEVMDKVSEIKASGGKGAQVEVQGNWELNGSVLSYGRTVTAKEINSKGESMNLAFDNFQETPPTRPPTPVPSRTPGREVVVRKPTPAPTRPPSTPNPTPPPRPSREEVRNSEVVAAKRHMEDLAQQVKNFAGDKKGAAYKRLTKLHERAKEAWEDKRKQLNRPEKN